MIILGVDPGLDTTGIAIVEGNKNKFKIKYLEEIKTKRKEVLGERLKNIFISLEKIIKEYQPSLLVLEKLYSHYKHPLTSSLLGHARGVIVCLATLWKLKIVEFASTQVKKAITSRGSASKDQVKRMVEYLSGVNNIGSQHLADALALVITYLHTQR